MPAGTGCHCDQSVDTRLNGFSGMPQVDHIMKYQPTIGMHTLDKFRHRAKRCNDDRHLMPYQHINFSLNHIIAAMNNQIHCERRQNAAVMQGNLVLYCVQPLIEPLERALVLGGKTAHNASLATGDNQFGTGGKKHRGRDKRQTQTTLKKRRQRHDVLLKVSADAACRSAIGPARRAFLDKG